MENRLGGKLVRMGRLARLEVLRNLFAKEVQIMANSFLRIIETNKDGVLSHVEVRSIFFDHIKKESLKTRRSSKRYCKVKLERLSLIINEC